MMGVGTGYDLHACLINKRSNANRKTRGVFYEDNIP